MIVARRPVLLFDVDVLGLVGVGVLLIAGWMTVLQPWQSTWRSFRSLVTQHQDTAQALEAEIANLKRVEQELERLQQVAQQESAEVLQEASLGNLLREVTRVAEETGITLHSVAPQSAQQQGAYLAMDILITGQGRSHDFIRFLDRVGCDNPCQSLEACSIAHLASEAAGETCRLKWTMRVYMLPGGPEGKSP